MKLSKQSRTVLLVEIKSRLHAVNDAQLLEVARVLQLNLPPRDYSDPTLAEDRVEPDWANAQGPR